MQNNQNILSKGTIIANRYEIQFPIDSNSFIQSYRAKNKNHDFVRLDLLNLASLPSSFFNDNGKLIQISVLKKINHTNISTLIEDGETIINKQKFTYLIFDFISGETLEEKLRREVKLSPYEAIPIILELLETLEYLHNLPDPIIHNCLSPFSVILDLSTNREKPVLIGFEQAREIHNTTQSISIKNLPFFYSAPELLNGVFIPQSDLFSVGALLHHLIFGIAPWYRDDILNQPINKVKGLIEKEREKILSFDFADEDEIDDQLKYTLQKALSIDIENRFQTANDFTKALKREVMLDKQEASKTFNNLVVKKEKKKGTGFDQIAGMNELKKILFNDVIRAITEKERFAKYGIPMLNGLLLYGPPGCGKTFIAQKFAEEVSFNFLMLKPADLKSQYINATEGIISKLFKDAEKNAPTIIFIDEFDSIVPSREGELHQMYANAVNEILAQMTNCGERGIFIIAATNRPEKIDSAVKRSGRIDKIVYIPPPDNDAREGMFRIYLKDRHIDLGIDFEKLSVLTENYVSSDIKFIIDEASRYAEKNDTRISQKILENIIKEIKPSITLKEINKYVALKQNWENDKQNFVEKEKRTPIGFKK